MGLKDKDTICIVFVDDYTRIESHDLEQEVEEEAEVDLNQNTNEPQRQIFVRTVHGNTITIDVRDSDTVQVLKNKIWVKDSKFPHSLALSFHSNLCFFGFMILYTEQCFVFV